MNVVVLGAAGWTGRAVLDNLAGKHTIRAFARNPHSWDAYAGYLVQHGQQASIVASYRRGHDDSVWRKDRDQHAIAETHGKELEFLCH